MPTNTPRLLLVKPLTSEAYDVGVANGNMDIVDGAPANVTICTSVTRPSTPDDGDLIYETDTLNMLVRQSGAWRLTVGRLPLYTSGTRPASAQSVAGMPIYETDTGRLLIRNSANTSWLDLQAPVVSLTSDVANPLVNQVAFETAKQSWRLRRSGSWQNTAVSGLVKAVYPTQTTSLTGLVDDSPEVDIPKLALTSVNVFNNHRYKFVYNLVCSGSTSGDVFDVKLRQTTPVSGTFIQSQRHCVPPSGNFGPQQTFTMYFTATSDANLDFYVSIVRVGGSGTLEIYQDSTMLNSAEMWDMGVVGQGIVTNIV